MPRRTFPKRTVNLGICSLHRFSSDIVPDANALSLSRSPTTPPSAIVMPAARHAFARLLSSPPALRSELARCALTQAGAGSAGPLLVGGETALRGIRTTRGGFVLGGYISCVGVGGAGTRRFASTTTAAAETSSSSPPPPTSTTPPRSTLSRALTRTALILIFFTTGFAMSAAPAAETVNGYVNPPSDEATLALFTPPTPTAEAINDHILTHPLAVRLRSQPNIVESRPHMKIPPAMRPHNLTGGTLLGEDKIAVPPLNFASKADGTDALPTLVQIAYLGDALCGHPGIIHGGLLATLLDEGLARACFPALPNKVGVTASLKIDYRVSCPAGSYVVLKAETTKVEGRKAWVKGWIELLGESGEGEGQKLVEAEALFVEPKGAKQMARVYSSQ